MFQLAPAATSGADTSPRLASYARDAPREAAAEAFCGATSLSLSSCLVPSGSSSVYAGTQRGQAVHEVGKKRVTLLRTCSRWHRASGSEARTEARSTSWGSAAAGWQLSATSLAWCPSACRRLLFRLRARFL